MRYLLDTHVWLWLLTDPDRLPQDVVARLAAVDAERLLSVASVWEVCIKHGSGRLPLPRPPGALLEQALRDSLVTELPVRTPHALRVVALPPHHRDPFDRLLVAQAQVEGLTVVTADAQVLRYDVALLPV